MVGLGVAVLIAVVTAQNADAVADNTTQVSLAFPTNVTQGSLLVIGASKFSSPTNDPYVVGDLTKTAGTATIGTVLMHGSHSRDLTGNAWSNVAIYTCLVTASGSLTLQVGSAAASSYLWMGITEVTGDWDASRQEDSQVGDGRADPTTPATASGTGAGRAIYFGCLSISMPSASAAITPGTGWSEVAEEEDGNTHQGGSLIYRIENSGGSFTANWEQMSGQTFGWAASLLVLREAVTFVITQPVWPIRVSSDGRYIEDSNARPLFIHGDTCWDLSHNLTLTEALTYLDDRWARGFNAIVYYPVSTFDVNGASEYPTNLPDRNGESPFSAGLTLNEAYWTHVDDVVQAMYDYGFIVFFWPAYLGLDDTEGIRTLLATQTTGACQTYGETLGTRYGSYGNIVWVHGGDTNPTTWASKVQAVQDGIASTDADGLHAVHWGSGEDPLDYPSDFPESRMDLYFTYTYPGNLGVQPTIGAMTFDHYEYPVTKPVFLGETDYELDWRAQTVDYIRRQPYRAICSGACGHVMGNRPIWFAGTGWESHLGGPLTVSIRHVYTLVNGRPWWRLVPSRDGNLLASGHGDPDTDTGVQAAMTASRDLAMAFFPSNLSVTVNLFALNRASEKVSAKWFDISNGQYTPIGVFGTFGTRVFTPPTNAAYVLVIEPEAFARRMGINQRVG